MKAFAIFPTICIFLLTLTLLHARGEKKPKMKLGWSFLVTIIFGGVMTMFSGYIFKFLFYANFLAAIFIIPCLTYLSNKCFPVVTGKKYWLRIVALGLISTVVTSTLFGATMIFSLLNNPMDPITQEQHDIKGDN